MGGGDKCLLRIGGRSILGHIIDRISPQAGRLALNANGEAARFDAYGLPVIGDGVADRPGPLAGILAAMDWAAAEGAAEVATVPSDTPFLPADLLARLRAAGSPAIAAGFRPGGALRLHPAIGVWPVHLRDALSADLREGQRRVRVWALAQGAVRVPFETPSEAADPFANVNTPEDLARARSRIAGAE